MLHSGEAEAEMVQDESGVSAAKILNLAGSW